MRSGLLMLMLAAAWGLMPAAPAGASADFQCVQKLDRDNSIVCAPPRGQLMQNSRGKYVCGPGRCVTSSSGRIVCSALPGGAIATDTMGRPLCDGGCVEPTEAMCVTPIPDES